MTLTYCTWCKSQQCFGLHPGYEPGRPEAVPVWAREKYPQRSGWLRVAPGTEPAKVEQARDLLTWSGFQKVGRGRRKAPEGAEVVYAPTGSLAGGRIYVGRWYRRRAA
jgi:hypothetical protein